MLRGSTQSPVVLSVQKVYELCQSCPVIVLSRFSRWISCVTQGGCSRAARPLRPSQQLLVCQRLTSHPRLHKTATADKHEKPPDLHSPAPRAASQNRRYGVHLVVCVPERSGVPATAAKGSSLSLRVRATARERTEFTFDVDFVTAVRRQHSFTANPGTADLNRPRLDQRRFQHFHFISDPLLPAPEPTRSCSLCAALANGEPRGNTPR